MPALVHHLLGQRLCSGEQPVASAGKRVMICAAPLRVKPRQGKAKVLLPLRPPAPGPPLSINQPSPERFRQDGQGRQLEAAPVRASSQAKWPPPRSNNASAGRWDGDDERDARTAGRAGSGRGASCSFADEGDGGVEGRAALDRRRGSPSANGGRPPALSRRGWDEAVGGWCDVETREQMKSGCDLLVSVRADDTASWRPPACPQASRLHLGWAANCSPGMDASTTCLPNVPTVPRAWSWTWAPARRGWLVVLRCERCAGGARPDAAPGLHCHAAEVKPVAQHLLANRRRAPRHSIVVGQATTTAPGPGRLETQAARPAQLKPASEHEPRRLPPLRITGFPRGRAAGVPAHANRPSFAQPQQPAASARQPGTCFDVVAALTPTTVAAGSAAGPCETWPPRHGRWTMGILLSR
ncbi:uncharacterized protein BDZ99DRAFT_478399 [Mytilinidion resinicola]|uniref:Uncharacterized protein n=1 Tax=Mytilinidion resinicola TaxID=574789 RepID=A0A6A6YGD5_9PEZI|nr:uncharacterized protein BDZ99DRAFT_478399 [Mytilinidion resinicola]KAF2807876.1 hypothetical protein BDZ99DRAFT_478399 [Mytilinidion resinicola]